ncbi:MAG: GDSL family lipase [Clostridia bacterium]|nr:GDSL family lipase [Clostridia bacterium]
MYTYTPTWENVKPLGRTHMLEDSLWLAFSGTGAEFTFHGCRAEVTIAGDMNATKPANEENQVRIAIYMNGTRVVDDMIDAKEKTYVVCDLDAAQDVTVRIIKLSETAMSTCGIKAIAVDSAEGIRPTAAKNRRIEFIGDSITCGYGVDDEVAEHHFSTATEDVTKAYAYKTAAMLDADYSMVSISGYGIISGYTATGEEKITAQTIPQFYEKLGFSYGTYQRKIAASIKWDFAAFQPDLIVVNLGTNDDSYTLDHPERQEEYCTAYTAFLKKVRANNPDAKILCTLGVMGDRLYPFVEKAAAAYTAETGDHNIACMRFVPQLASDGYAADWHPTETTHNKAAAKLTAEIRTLMGWN